MVWSLLRVIFFITLVAALTYGVIFLWELESSAFLTVAGREYTVTPLLGAVLAIVAYLAIWLAIRLFGLLWASYKYLRGDETALNRYLTRRRQRQGYEAMSESMLALAAGEGHMAIRKAQRAASKLQRPELTNILIAQGAEMVGDKALATETLKAMLTHDQTRFVGIRGLISQKLDEGDTDTAMKLSQKALTLRPKNAEIQDTLLGLQTQEEDWQGARATLATKLKSGTLPRDVHRRREAVLALAHARDALAEGKIEDASKDASEANRLSPDLVPAAVMSARMSVEQGNARAATRTLRKAWVAAPHPDLAAAFAEIAPDETPSERLLRFRPLLTQHADDPEVTLLHTELLIATEDFAKARKTLGDLPETSPDARTLTLMAAIERGEGGEDHHVRAWLARAVAAPRGPQWMCQSCSHVHEDWQPICENCDSFDTLCWARPKQSDAAVSSAAHMLPLIVGALEDKSSDSPDEAEILDPDNGQKQEAAEHQN